MVGVAVGVAIGLQQQIGGGSSAPVGNLLLWTEHLDNAAWGKVVVTVSPDAAANPNPPGDGSSSADQCSFASGNRRIEQVTGLATAGASNLTNINPVPGSWTRYSVSTTFPDIGALTASVYVQHVSNSGTLRLGLDNSGGFVRTYLLSVTNAVAVNVWGWQLETGASATAYQPRTT
jgi:hypothetical protein